MSKSAYSTAALKRAGLQSLTGKVVSAALTFIILLWLVRLLPVAEFGAYVVLVAGVELGFVFAGLGLPWLAARYIPEYRLNADGRSIAKLSSRLILWQALALLVLAVAFATALGVYLDWTGLVPYRSAAWFALGVLITEGLARFEREGLLAPLLLQRELRASFVLRQLAFLTAIAALDFMGHGSVDAVIAAECGAALLGLIWAHIALRRHLGSLRDQPCTAGWQAPPLRSQWQVARHMYTAHLITIASGPQIFLILIQRALGAEAAALFGFLRTLYEQITRYLPATLLFSVIRPKLMASFVTGGMQAVTRQANLVGKLSLFVLMPLIMFVALGGDVLIALLSGHKFIAAGSLLLGLLLALVPYSQRQLLETVAVAAGQPGLCTRGATVALLALPLMLGLLQFDLGLWAPVLAMIAGQVFFNVTVVAGLASHGYRSDYVGSSKLAISATLAWLTATWITGGERAQSVGWICLACALALAAYLAVTWRLKPFGVTERERLNAMAGRRLFVW